jgi:hypothetical protein
LALFMAPPKPTVTSPLKLPFSWLSSTGTRVGGAPDSLRLDIGGVAVVAGPGDAAGAVATAGVAAGIPAAIGIGGARMGGAEAAVGGGVTGAVFVRFPGGSATFGGGGNGMGLTVLSGAPDRAASSMTRRIMASMTAFDTPSFSSCGVYSGEMRKSTARAVLIHGTIASVE